MSVRIVAQVHAADAASGAGLEAIAARLSACAEHVDEIARSHAAVHSPGSMGGGHITWDTLFASEAKCGAFCERIDRATPVGAIDALGPSFADLQTSIAGVDAAVLEPVRSHVGQPGLAGVKRTLWLRVQESVCAEDIARFERELLLLPSEVPAIRNWSLSRVDTAGPLPVRWTHVWEQEFENAEGLNGDYMASPYHWGHLDGWFDLENPKCIVDPWLAHLYCPARESVLSWTER